MDEEISFRNLAEVIWNGRLLIVICSLLMALLSVIAAFSINNVYTAKAVLAPANQSPAGISSLLKQYGGFASLAGVSLPASDEASQVDLGLELVQSRAFVREFVERRGILPQLMASQSWDIQSQSLSYDHAIYDDETKTWTRKVKSPYSKKPNFLEAHEQFLEILSVSEDRKTGFITLAVEHASPKVAADWVTWIIEDVNAAVRQSDIEEATKSIEYLTAQIEGTRLSELQAVFFELIQSQTEKVMLAEVRPEYVFKTIDPAVPPNEPSKPHRLLICVLGLLFGVVLGIGTVLFNFYRTRIF